MSWTTSAVLLAPLLACGTAVAFLMRMNRDPSVIRCAMVPGRVDTVVGRLMEDGARILRP
jgi:hypothetical protein